MKQQIASSTKSVPRTFFTLIFTLAGLITICSLVESKSACKEFLMKCNILKDSEWGNGIVAEFQISKSDSAIMLPTKINGNDYNFILDTGSDMTIFSSKVRQTLGAKIRAQSIWRFTGFFIDTEVYKPPKEFMIGPLPVLVEEVLYLDDFKKYGMSENLDGVIGMDFLKNYIVKLDFDIGKAQFVRPDYKYKNNTQKFDIVLNGANKPFLKNSIVPYLSTKVNNHEVRFLIDTGFPHPQIGYLQDDIFQIILKKQTSSTIEVLINEKSEQGVLAEISFGKYNINPVVLLSRHSSILGIDFLRLCGTVIFDFPGKKISFHSKSYDSITLGDIGITIKINEDNRLQVTSVDKKGDAYTDGVRVNDLIIEMYGIDTKNYSIKEIEKMTDINKTKPYNIKTSRGK